MLKPFVKPTLVVFGIIMLGMVAILRANFSYMDDLARAAEGYKGWGNFSRYLSNFLAMILNGNGFLTDISPWPQIVAALIMAINGVMLLYIIYGRKKFRWWELFVVAMLALNPYFLECLSYKFDAPFMAVAVFGMIVPFVAWKVIEEGKMSQRRKTVMYAAAVVVGTLVTCTTYQAALGVLPMVTVLVAVRMWNRGEEWGKIWRFVLKAVAGYGVALVVFKVFIMRLVDAYVVTEVPGLMEIVPHTLSNIKQYYQMVVADFAKTWLVLVVGVTVWFVGMIVMDSRQRKWLAGIVGMVSVVVLGVLCFGIYVVMKQPLFEPRAMFGFGVMVCLLAVVVVEERELGRVWQKCMYVGGATVAVVLMYLFGVFGFTYGNALAEQKAYTDFRIEAVANDLGDLVQEGDRVEVVGVIGFAPVLTREIGEYPVLARLVPVEFSEGYWGQYRIFRYYGLRDVQGEMFEVPVVVDYPIIKEGWYHNLRSKEGKIVVELKDKK